MEHLLDVAGRAARLAGLPHDVLEDTNTTVEDLRRGGASCEVIDAVSTVTRRPEETYDQFIDRVVRRGGLALRVKHADLRSYLGRRDGISEDAIRRRLQAKYEPAVAKVEAALTAVEQLG